jgi:hypothetical protein
MISWNDFTSAKSCRGGSFGGSEYFALQKSGFLSRSVFVPGVLWGPYTSRFGVVPAQKPERRSIRSLSQWGHGRFQLPRNDIRGDTGYRGVGVSAPFITERAVFRSWRRCLLRSRGPQWHWRSNLRGDSIFAESQPFRGGVRSAKRDLYPSNTSWHNLPARISSLFVH